MKAKWMVLVLLGALGGCGERAADATRTEVAVVSTACGEVRSTTVYSTRTLHRGPEGVASEMTARQTTDAFASCP